MFRSQLNRQAHTHIIYNIKDGQIEKRVDYWLLRVKENERLRGW
jgi:competence protein ComGF